MRRLLEGALVMALIGIPATLLLQRLHEVRDDAARVQLRMAAEAVRLNAQLFQMRCGATPEPDCWRALLATRRDAARDAQPDPAMPPAPPDLLRSVALAAGLADAPQWQLQALDATHLLIALKDVAQCRFVLATETPGYALRIENVEDRCCSRAPCA